MRILKKDFDAAVKQPWVYDKCFIAQAMTRMGMKSVGLYPYTFAFLHGLRHIQKTFDKYFEAPGDETRPELQKLRASLPITFK